MATKAPEIKQDFFLTEVEFRSALSEALLQKVATSTNFINARQYDKHSWHLNGDFTVVQLADVGDGVFICQEDIEVVGYGLHIARNGSTGGPIIVDLRLYLPDGTDQGTIFTTKPEISTAAADNSTSHANIRDNDNEIPTGHTLGVFNQLNFNRHDVIKLSLDNASGGAQGLQFTLMFRPR